MEDNRYSKYYIFLMGISFVFVTTALLLLKNAKTTKK